MHINGTQHLDALISGKVHDLKMVFNANGLIVFPSSRQHREMKGEGISYEDNYAGNALAAMVRRDAIEIRYHARFTDADVVAVVRTIVSLAELSVLRGATVTYQGRVVLVATTSQEWP